jgi:isopentenyl-diphosphate delta-isomerase
VIPALGIPALVKEVGAGISRATALKLSGLPLHGIETGGVGGTSWSKIESLRAEPGPQRRVGNRFARWGIPTAESVPICRAAFGDRLVIASGGIRNGIEVAKAIALGADAAALALPFLRAAEHSAEAVVLEIEGVLAELRAALFLTGCASIAELKRRGPAILTRNPDPTSA